MDHHIERPVFTTTLTPWIRAALIIFMTIMLMVSLFGCEAQQTEFPLKSQRFSPEGELQRSQLRIELNQMNASIDRELEKVRAAFREHENRQELLLVDRKLKSNKAKIEKALLDIENCPEERWAATRARIIDTTIDVASSFKRTASSFQDISVTP